MGTTTKPSRRQRFRETGGCGDAYFVRQHLGLSTRDLAHVLGCSHVTVYRWEDGLHAEPEGLYGVVVRGVANLVRGFNDDVRPLVSSAWGDSIQFAIEHDESSFALLRRLVTPPSPPGYPTWEAFANRYYGDDPRPTDAPAQPTPRLAKNAREPSASAPTTRRVRRARKE